MDVQSKSNTDLTFKFLYPSLVFNSMIQGSQSYSHLQIVENLWRYLNYQQFSYNYSSSHFHSTYLQKHLVQEAQHLPWLPLRDPHFLHLDESAIQLYHLQYRLHPYSLLLQQSLAYQRGVHQLLLYPQYSLHIKPRILHKSCLQQTPQLQIHFVT